MTLRPQQTVAWPNFRTFEAILVAERSEDSVLRVLETATGRDLAERISNTQYTDPQWLDDGSGFFYTQLTSPVGTPERLLDAPLAEVLAGRAHWTPVAGFEDEVTDLDLHEGQLYLLANKGSPLQARRLDLRLHILDGAGVAGRARVSALHLVAGKIAGDRPPGAAVGILDGRRGVGAGRRQRG